MSDYDRSTTAMSLATLPEPISRAAEALQLTVAEDAQAFLTHSRKLKKGGLLARMTRTADPDTEHLTGRDRRAQRSRVSPVQAATRVADAATSDARSRPGLLGPDDRADSTVAAGDVLLRGERARRRPVTASLARRSKRPIGCGGVRVPKLSTLQPA